MLLRFLFTFPSWSSVVWREEVEGWDSCSGLLFATCDWGEDTGRSGVFEDDIPGITGSPKVWFV